MRGVFFNTSHKSKRRQVCRHKGSISLVNIPKFRSDSLNHTHRKCTSRTFYVGHTLSTPKRPCFILEPIFRLLLVCVSSLSDSCLSSRRPSRNRPLPRRKVSMMINRTERWFEMREVVDRLGVLVVAAHQPLQSAARQQPPLQQCLELLCAFLLSLESFSCGD